MSYTRDESPWANELQSPVFSATEIGKCVPRSNHRTPGKQVTSRWYQFRTTTLLVATARLTFLFIVLIPVLQQWNKSRVQTISVSLVSSGDVVRGDRRVEIEAIQPELERSAKLLRSHGFKPKLVIECYQDTRDADVAALSQLGRNAGFDFVDVERRSWSSPQANRSRAEEADGAS